METWPFSIELLIFLFYFCLALPWFVYLYIFFNRWKLLSQWGKIVRSHGRTKRQPHERSQPRYLNKNEFFSLNSHTDFIFSAIMLPHLITTYYYITASDAYYVPRRYSSIICMASLFLYIYVNACLTWGGCVQSIETCLNWMLVGCFFHMPQLEGISHESERHIRSIEVFGNLDE